MKIGRQTLSRGTARLAIAGCWVATLACQQPSVGDRAAATSESAGPKIEITGATIEMGGHVIATFSMSQDGRPLGPAEATALDPRFTLATLGEHPVDGFAAWKSQVPTGEQVVDTLPLTPPDDPAPITTTSVRQPGAESWTSGSPTGEVTSIGNGRFEYVFANPVVPFDPVSDASTTIRVGVWLEGAPGATRTSSTYDFRPDLGTPQSRNPVLDDGCATCHGTLVHHGHRSGVRLCATCHTWQNADRDTADPAAMYPASPATNPNPLELGRLVHRIHRGKDLPTVYASLWQEGLPSTVPSASPLPRPFQPNRSGAFSSMNEPELGRKYSVIAEDGHEHVYAQAVTVASTDPTLKTETIVDGGVFPRDLRDCAVCHGGAPEGNVVTTAVSRRTCSGCHPEVWYQAPSPAADPVRFPHTGGPQADDSACLGCHVTGAPPPLKLYAPIAEIHVPPVHAPRHDTPVIEIVHVEDLAPGKRPKITYRLTDRVGPIAPKPNAPVPAFEPDGPTSSYVPRKLSALLIHIMGPTTPDYAYYSSVQLNSGAEQRESPTDTDWDPLAISTVSGTDEYVYTFTSVIPPGATGTYVVGMEARRGVALPTDPAKKVLNRDYDPSSDVFRWPYTGEILNESADNALVYVNTASGVWPPPAGSPAPVPRRTVVDQQKCNRCHDRIEFHQQRNAIAWCITCHTPDRTDWEKRIDKVKNAGNADGTGVILGRTYDGIEERSTHLKTMVHRIHTGSRKGAASLEAIAPYVVYYGEANFFDRGGFPNELRNCTVCHDGKTYLLENLPADAPPTLGNEHDDLVHGAGAGHPLADLSQEPFTPPMQAACTGCHATGATFAHVASKTVNGVETCTSCHAKGSVSVEVAHGLASPSGGAGSTFSSIVQAVLVPRCATSACHSGTAGVYPQLDADAAYAALVGEDSGQAPMKLVDPGKPESSYLLYKLRGDVSAAGGSGQPMPIGDALLDPADIAAIEAWIANGAQND